MGIGGHKWAWLRYYWAWVGIVSIALFMREHGLNKAYWKGSLNELSFNASEGKSTESPSPSKVSPSFRVSSSSKVLSSFVGVPCYENYASM